MNWVQKYKQHKKYTSSTILCWPKADSRITTAIRTEGKSRKGNTCRKWSAEN